MDHFEEFESCTVHAKFYSGDELDAGKGLGKLDRITVDPGRMQGKPCIRGTRITVSAIVGMVAAGHSVGEILAAYPLLEREDVSQALDYAYVLCGGYYDSIGQ